MTAPDETGPCLSMTNFDVRRSLIDLTATIYLSKSFFKYIMEDTILLFRTDYVFGKKIGPIFIKKNDFHWHQKFRQDKQCQIVRTQMLLKVRLIKVTATPHLKHSSFKHTTSVEIFVLYAYFMPKIDWNVSSEKLIHADHTKKTFPRNRDKRM